MTRWRALACLWLWTLCGTSVTAAIVDSPELGRMGPEPIGVSEKTVVNHDQVDVIRSMAEHRIITADRTLRLLIWYPSAAGGRPTPYRASLTSPSPLPPKPFSIPALAVRDAKAVKGAHPVVIISHGFSNDPAMMSWIGENLATKGYVVVAIAHDDPGYTDLNRLIKPILLRPLDIAFVAHEIRSGFLGNIADPTKIALIGYSMGGYGVLTAAGAQLDYSEKLFLTLPESVLARYKRGGPDAGALSSGDIKAVITIAPGGKTPFSTCGKDGLAGVHAPLMVIAGDADRLVGFEGGPAAIFTDAVNSERTLLVFKEGGHSIGVGPTPAAMHGSVWDQDWFEDPVWRKDRVTSISLHFITAFLDLHLKGDASRADYFNVSNPESNKASWTGPDSPYDAMSQGGSNSAWKGFVRNHQVGLVLRHLEAASQPQH